MRRRCPECGSKNTARILWGYPLPDEKLLADLDAGRVVLGECVVPLEPWPTHTCRDCGHEGSKSRRGASIPRHAAGFVGFGDGNRDVRGGR